MNRKVSIFSAVVVASLISGSLAYATTVTSSKVTACADKKTGILRAATRCKSSEKSVPLISGSVQLAPRYYDANNKTVDVLSSNFSVSGFPVDLIVILNGKFAYVNGTTGTVYPLGDTQSGYSWVAESQFNPITFQGASCTGTPFLWLADNSRSQYEEMLKTLRTNPNYAGYFGIFNGQAEDYYALSSSPVGFADHMRISHRSLGEGICTEDLQSNNGEGYTSTGYSTVALTPYTGARLPNFAGPIKVKTQ